MDKQERKNRVISMYVSIGIHALLLLVFFITLAWTEPDPPIPEYGIEFNLAENYTAENSSSESLPKEVVEEIEEVSEENISDSGNATQEPEPVPSEETVSPDNENSENQAVDPTVTDDTDSPDVVEETLNNEQTKKTEIEEVGADTDSETKETSETREEMTAEEGQSEEPEIDDRAIFKKKANGEKAGSPGSSLDLTGWNWDFKPNPNDRSAENGIIVFQITIDEEGEIIGIKTLEKTVSPVVEKVYRDAVMELTFSKTADNRTAANTSVGKITFIIQSN